VDHLDELVRPGDATDRLTILDLKRHRLGSGLGRERAARQFAIWRKVVAQWDVPDEFVSWLHELNSQLWDAEVEIRAHLAADNVSEVARVAAVIVRLNDARHEAKRLIDSRLGPTVYEDKDYSGCRPTISVDDPEPKGATRS
jgi:hypothetical protein